MFVAKFMNAISIVGGYLLILFSSVVFSIVLILSGHFEDLLDSFIWLLVKWNVMTLSKRRTNKYIKWQQPGKNLLKSEDKLFCSPHQDKVINPLLARGDSI